MPADTRTPVEHAAPIDHQPCPDGDASQYHDLCGVCGWPVSRELLGRGPGALPDPNRGWSHDPKNPCVWTDKRATTKNPRA